MHQKLHLHKVPPSLLIARYVCRSAISACIRKNINNKTSTLIPKSMPQQDPYVDYHLLESQNALLSFDQTVIDSLKECNDFLEGISDTHSSHSTISTSSHIEESMLEFVNFNQEPLPTHNKPLPVKKNRKAPRKLSFQECSTTIDFGKSSVTKGKKRRKSYMFVIEPGTKLLSHHQTCKTTAAPSNYSFHYTSPECYQNPSYKTPVSDQYRFDSPGPPKETTYFSPPPSPRGTN